MIRLDRLSKVYGTGDDATTVLRDLDFSVEAGRIFAVVGPSGAGKSTLAQCVSLLERPTSGRVIVNGEDLTSLPAAELRTARRRIGTIFQHDGLFARRTAAQNVALPLEYLGVTKAEARSRVAELLDRVGLSDKARRYPHELSGGQRQRVGIARALALRPSVLLSDEATSGLDPDATASIVALLRELRTELGISILFITHEMDTVLRVADSVARLDHGRIVEQGAVVDLLRDADSPLGNQLRPRREAVAAPSGQTAWQVTYRGDEVPADWPLRVADRLGVAVSLLAAEVDRVDGATVGRATVGLPADADRRDLEAAFAALGLDLRAAGDGPGVRGASGTTASEPDGASGTTASDTEEVAA